MITAGDLLNFTIDSYGEGWYLQSAGPDMGKEFTKYKYFLANRRINSVQTFFNDLVSTISKGIIIEETYSDMWHYIVFNETEVLVFVKLLAHGGEQR